MNTHTNTWIPIHLHKRCKIFSLSLLHTHTHTHTHTYTTNTNIYPYFTEDVKSVLPSHAHTHTHTHTHTQTCTRAQTCARARTHTHTLTPIGTQSFVHRLTCPLNVWLVTLALIWNGCGGPVTYATMRYHVAMMSLMIFSAYSLACRNAWKALSDIKPQSQQVFNHRDGLVTHQVTKSTGFQPR